MNGNVKVIVKILVGKTEESDLREINKCGVTQITQKQYTIPIQGVPGGMDKTSGECSLC